ncbi:hypothetical protein V496_04724 [Pseudogymnoascus sp. VKM F-4515 (FW-2607)]|nr:hypothetical protein V496_04724 [Pseudogymnoascus sp. VKM F-4515 (FW-2607)]
MGDHRAINKPSPASSWQWQERDAGEAMHCRHHTTGAGAGESRSRGEGIDCRIAVGEKQAYAQARQGTTVLILPFHNSINQSIRLLHAASSEGPWHRTRDPSPLSPPRHQDWMGIACTCMYRGACTVYAALLGWAGVIGLRID